MTESAKKAIQFWKAQDKAEKKGNPILESSGQSRKKRQSNFGKLRTKPKKKARMNLSVRCAAEKHGGIEASTMVIFIAAAILADF